MLFVQLCFEFGAVKLDCGYIGNSYLEGIVTSCKIIETCAVCRTIL